MAINQKELVRTLLLGYLQEESQWMASLLKDIGVLSLMPHITVSELRELCKEEADSSKAAKFEKTIQKSLSRISGHLENAGFSFKGVAESRSLQRALVEILTED